MSSARSLPKGLNKAGKQPSLILLVFIGLVILLFLALAGGIYLTWFRT